MNRQFLDIQDLACGYDRQMVLHHINFQAQKGEVVTIIGPNGSGKTTLLKTIPGLIHALEGYALLDQEDLSQMPAKLKAKRVAMVMQPMESIYMTVEEYVLLGRLPYFKTYQFIEDPSDIRAADKYLEYTGISHLKGESLSRISSGERQLATIAKALAQEPELLLMDEPTSHLDISHQAQILKLITDLKQQHDLTVVMVQHDLNLAGEYSDQVILLDKETQTLYKSGSPKEVITEAHIRAVYHTDVVVESNPHSGRPGVFLRKS